MNINKIRQKYDLLNVKLKKKLYSKLRKNNNYIEVNVRRVGLLKFANIDLKTIDILDLFNINEQLAFNFYIKNIKNYKKVCDIGANIGIHTIILSKIGYDTVAFEPDPIHYKLLKKNLKLNKLTATVIQSAVYNFDGSLKFIRVIDHSPKSHLEVSKKNINSFGKKKSFKVKVLNFRRIINNFDLVKIDAEGSEAKIIKSLKKNSDFTSDILLEISNKKNANFIYKHLKKLKIKFYNLSNFNKKNIKTINDMPHGHIDGFLIIKKYAQMLENE
jgi:FkbM family methyltransferase